MKATGNGKDEITRRDALAHLGRGAVAGGLYFVAFGAGADDAAALCNPLFGPDIPWCPGVANGEPDALCGSTGATGYHEDGRCAEGIAGSSGFYPDEECGPKGGFADIDQNCGNNTPGPDASCGQQSSTGTYHGDGGCGNEVQGAVQPDAFCGATPFGVYDEDGRCGITSGEKFYGDVHCNSPIGETGNVDPDGACGKNVNEHIMDDVSCAQQTAKESISKDDDCGQYVGSEITAYEDARCDRGSPGNEWPDDCCGKGETYAENDERCGTSEGVVWSDVSCGAEQREGHHIPDGTCGSQSGDELDADECCGKNFSGTTREDARCGQASPGTGDYGDSKDPDFPDDYECGGSVGGSYSETDYLCGQQGGTSGERNADARCGQSTSSGTDPDDRECMSHAADESFYGDG